MRKQLWLALLVILGVMVVCTICNCLTWHIVRFLGSYRDKKVVDSNVEFPGFVSRSTTEVDRLVGWSFTFTDANQYFDYFDPNLLDYKCKEYVPIEMTIGDQTKQFTAEEFATKLGFDLNQFIAKEGFEKKVVLDTKPVDPNIVPLDKHILAEPNDWVNAYGDNEKTKIYYNLAFMRMVIDNQGKVITQLIRDVNDLKVRTALPNKAEEYLDELWMESTQ